MKLDLLYNKIFNLVDKYCTADTFSIFLQNYSDITEQIA